MICKEGAIDVISINGSNGVGGGGGGGGTGNGINDNNIGTHQSTLSNGYNTLQNRRKSQLITFSASSCDIKNSLSHEIIVMNNSSVVHNGNGGVGSQRNSVVSNGGGSGSGNASNGGGSGSSSVGSRGNVRLSFAEEDVLIVSNGIGQQQQQQQQQQTQPQHHQHQRHASGSAGSANGSTHGDIDELGEDEVFRRRSLEGDDADVVEEDEGEELEEDELFNDEFETHIETKSNNANDDSGGGSYEDSHALHSSLGGSNRNSLEKDDDDIEVDVISTDVSCYDQLLGSSSNTRNGDDDDIATLVGDGEHYTTKLCKTGGGAVGIVGLNVGDGITNSVGGGSGSIGGIIYANPFMDDEGIAESGM